MWARGRGNCRHWDPPPLAVQPSTRAPTLPTQRTLPCCWWLGALPAPNAWQYHALPTHLREHGVVQLLLGPLVAHGGQVVSQHLLRGFQHLPDSWYVGRLLRPWYMWVGVAVGGGRGGGGGDAWVPACSSSCVPTCSSCQQPVLAAAPASPSPSHPATPPPPFIPTLHRIADRAGHAPHLLQPPPAAV